MENQNPQNIRRKVTNCHISDLVQSFSYLENVGLNLVSKAGLSARINSNRIKQAFVDVQTKGLGYIKHPLKYSNNLHFVICIT